MLSGQAAFLPGAAPEGSLPGGDPSSTLPLIFTLQTPQEPLQLQSKQCRKAVRFHPPRATVPTAPGLRKTLLSGGFLHEKDHASYRSPCLGAGAPAPQFCSFDIFNCSRETLVFQASSSLHSKFCGCYPGYISVFVLLFSISRSSVSSVFATAKLSLLQK